MEKSIYFTQRRVFMSAILFLLLFPGLVFAAQGQVTVKGKAMSIKQAIQKIEEHSSYTFFYKAADLDNTGKKDMDYQGDIQTVLGGMFEGSGIIYQIKGNEITLKGKTGTVAVTQQKSDKQTITGVVKDNIGESVIGATILEKGTTNGTITDLDGKFTLSVHPGATIVISYIGYATQEVKAVPGAPMNIIMKDDSKTLDEVVVVGFGSQKKANLTGAVSSIKMDEAIGDRPITTVSEALQGTVPGLLVSSGGNAPGTGKTFQLRGAYTVGQKSDDNKSYGKAIGPLILIDNVEGSMDMLNPEDIETITVLKDAASASIYGARAAGGVILITTKRPQGATAFRLNYNNNFGFASAINLPKQAPLMDYLQAYQDGGYSDTYWSYGSPKVSKWKEYLTQYQKDPSSIPTVGDGIFADTDGALYYLNEHDPYNSFMETSFQMTHNISLTGGTDKLRYRISAGYISNDGVLITDKDTYERMNVSSYISADITKWYTQEITMNYSRTGQTQPSSGLGSMFGSSLVSYHPEGDMPASVCGTISKDLPFNTPSNQVKLANKWERTYDNPRTFIKSIFKPFKGFEGVFEYTFDKKMMNYSYYTGKTQYTDIQGGNNIWNVAKDYLQKQKQYTDYNAFNIYGTYKFNFTDHNFSVMAGFNQESSHTEDTNVYSYNQAVIEVPALGSGTGEIKATDSYNEYSVRGGFFRVNYNYMNKYLLEVNGRYDGSSRFPKNSRFGFFPSVSAGWNVAQEKFMEATTKYLDGLKLRASYGVIGNQNVVNYAFYPTMTISNKYNGWLSDGNYVTAINSLPNLVSRSFTWEKVATTDIGLDLNMFGNRLNAVFDWYQRDTKGMLAPGVQLPAVVGTSSPFQNTADMRTRGWELAVNWRDQIGKLNYRVGFNLSDSRSEITRYDDNAASKLLKNFYPGQQIGEIWGYEVDGFYTVDDFVDTKSWKLKEGVTSIKGVSVRPGDLKFKNFRDDKQSTNQIDAGDETLDNPGDQKVIGNNLPRYLYGINLGAGYKGFDLSVFFQGTGKRDEWIANNLVFPMYLYAVNDMKYQPLFEGLTDYWKPVDAANGDYTAVNPDATYPRMYGQNPTAVSNYSRKTDRFLSNAAYFRIKNITLSYTVPKHWVSKVGLNQLKGFVSVENLATFSSLPSGIDPETLSWNYPAFRTVSFGINFTL